LNRAKVSEKAIRNHYELTADGYNEMFASQEGKCLICKRHQEEFSKRLFVDHDHRTKKVRGLLCQNCNSGLGMFADDIERLKNAVNYLEKYGK
jgi:hypothetical protein